MVSPFTLPPAGFGAGSQPDPDGDLQYMPMPSGMRVYAPHIPDAADRAARAEAIALLDRMAAACDAVAGGAAPVALDLAGLSPAARAVLADALGQGEVSMKLRGKPAVMVQESVFAGVWMLLAEGLDQVDGGQVPSLARTRAHVPHRPAFGVLARRVPGLANAPSILAELVDRSMSWHAGAARCGGSWALWRIWPRLPRVSRHGGWPMAPPWCRPRAGSMPCGWIRRGAV